MKIFKKKIDYPLVIVDKIIDKESEGMKISKECLKSEISSEIEGDFDHHFKYAIKKKLIECNKNTEFLLPVYPDAVDYIRDQTRNDNLEKVQERSLIAILISIIALILSLIIPFF